MTILNINLAENIVLKGEDEKKISFLVSRVVYDYFEDKQDKILSSEIERSEELDNIINNIKF